VSYLGYPRLNFAGTFQADVPTANNTPEYFNADLWEPRLARPMALPDVNGWWNPGGTGDIRLTDVRVTSTYAADGTLTTDAGKDGLVGGRLVDDDLRTNGKFVDLDPSDQLITELYAMRPKLVDAEGRQVLRADVVTTAVEDIWLRSMSAAGIPYPAGAYQSVLTGLEWADDLDSPVLAALRACTQEGRLSIRFAMDSVELGFAGPSDKTTFGRIVGAIGPYYAGEPKRFVAGRRLRKVGDDGPLADACFRVDDATGTVFVDLGNSIPTTEPYGPLKDVGELRLAVLDDAGKPTVLAPLAGMDADFYTRDAGIATARLTPDQVALAGGSRLALVDSATTPATVLSENADATWIHVDGSVQKLYAGTGAGESGSAPVYATRYGKPAGGLRVSFTPVSPGKALSLPDEVVTDSAGHATLTFSCSDPGNPRGYIDGDLAQVTYGSVRRPGEPDGQIHFRVFDAYRAPERPTWVRDVEPIFRQYANLYPVMRDILDLGNYNHVLRHATYIKRTLTAPQESPNHMPVTRDLSPGKRDMIVSWLNTAPTPPLLDIATVDDLRDVLQQAMLVELATIPPYLAALVSIKPDRNVKIAELIRGVVLEEMQHMAQVCNLLNAVGGTPRVGRPARVPTYPGKLPGPVLPDLQVRLRRLSLEHVKDVFMAIEQPEYPVVDGEVFKGAVISPGSAQLDRKGRVLSADPQAMDTLERWFVTAEHKPQTIGWLYNQIARAIVRLDRGGKLFTGDPARQVAWPDAPTTLYQITDKRSALLAIYQIVEQGEGTPTDIGHTSAANELGHYYRFEEIVKGHELVRNAKGAWVFEGPEIPFDPDGVYPVVDDADTYNLPADSAERRASQLCDEAYTNLLGALSRMVNGHPEEMDNIVGLMSKVQVLAKNLVTMPSAAGASTVLGPAFQSPGMTDA
jgi:Ferritin-like